MVIRYLLFGKKNLLLHLVLRRIENKLVTVNE